MSRLPELDESALSTDQQKIFDAIASGPRGTVAGPLRVWLQSPELAACAQKLGQYARYDSVLSENLSELAILVTARYWSSGFEWAHHAPIALQAGVPKMAVEAIAHARKYTFDDPKMQVVFDFAVDLHLNKKLSDGVYDAAKAVLGLQACVDLVGICGYYTLISMTINVFDVVQGEGPDLPKLDRLDGDYFAA